MQSGDLAAIEVLAREAESEGFRFVTRFLADVAARRTSFDGVDDFFLGAFDEQRLLALGGVTADPYLDDAATGRVRHVYVRRSARRQGVGGELVRALEARAWLRYRRLRLRAENPSAARFYEQLGYTATDEPNATHTRIPCEE